MLLFALLIRKATDILGNPFSIDLQKFTNKLNYEERISFIERFHRDFEKIFRLYSEGQTVFVFIDDLDRCEIPKAADIMQAINLLMSDSCKIIYILGLARNTVAAGLAAKYEKLLPYIGDQRLNAAGNSTAQIGADFGFDFLEKFIQIPYQVPRPSEADIPRLLSQAGAAPASSPSTQNVDPGILFQTRVDSPLVNKVVSMVAPALNYNPRRIKQFVNCFRLTAITASTTGLFGPPRTSEFSQLTPEQLGKMVAICLRWPRLIGDAMQYPPLLQVLEQSSAVDAELKVVRDYWMSKPQLVSLIRYQVPIVGVSSYSLAKLDIERYVQVSPAVVFRRSDSGSGAEPRAQPAVQSSAPPRPVRTGRPASRTYSNSKVTKK